MTHVQRFSLVRGLHLADVFTLANACAGAGAVLAALSFVETGERWRLLLAIALGPIAFICDALDGRVARLRGKASLMGRELDSLSDVISFGVAPVVIAHAVGFTGGWDRVALLFFVACAVARLARYNATADLLAAGGAKVPYFEGTPVTFSLLPSLALGVAVATDNLSAVIAWGAVRVGPFLLHPPALVYVLAGCLMISKTIRVPKL